MAIESYCIFNDFPDFMPMFSPQTMLEHGIHEGVALNKKFCLIKVSEDWVKGGLDLRKAKLSNDGAKIELNAYGVRAMEVPEELRVFDTGGPIGWLKWYFGFYYGARTDQDLLYIAQWENIILWAYSGEAEPSHELDQLLLSYSWNPGWAPEVLRKYKPK